MTRRWPISPGTLPVDILAVRQRTERDEAARQACAPFARCGECGACLEREERIIVDALQL